MSCCCKDKNILIFSCSGGANTGKAADLVARELTKQKLGLISCLGSIGAGISGFIESAKSAEYNIVIDGCPVSCGKKTLENNGIKNYEHIVITDLGVEKGKTKITDEIIGNLCNRIKETINQEKK